MRFITLFVLFLLASFLPARANQPGGFVSTVTTPVTTGTTSYNGKPCVFMDNGIIHATINMQGAVLSMRFLKPGLSGTPLNDGVEMIGQSSGSTTLYGGNLDLFYSDPGNVMAFGASAATYATPPTAAQADYAFIDTYNPAQGCQPWDSIVHWVLRQGDTGIYSYLVINHPASYGSASSPGLTLEWGSAHDSKNFLLEDTFVDNMGAGLLDNRGLPESRRHGLSVSFEDENYIVDAVQDNYQIVNTDPESKFYGYLDTKYAYIDDLFLLGCWGRASDVNHLGGWFVQGSHEFSPSGPAYTDFTQGWGLVDDCLTSLHGVQAGFTVPQGTAFRKVYGPTLLYMNTLATGTANWADAQQQAAAEQAAWPYSWLTYEPAYQTAAQRATVTGTISIVDEMNSSVSGNGAWVGLAAPDDGSLSGGLACQEAGNWITQSAHNQYWVRASANGAFSFPNIATTDCYGNPEQYALYVYSNGVSGSNGAVGEYMSPSFTATAGQTLNLGAVTWTVPHEGTSIVWQIGNPDRLSDEFANFQTSIQPQNWEYNDSGYNDMNPPLSGPVYPYYTFAANPLEYDTATGNPLQLSWQQTNDNGLWPWDLNFNLSGAPASGNYWLTIAYAGNRVPGGGIVCIQQVAVNGVPLYFDIAGYQQDGFPPANHTEANQAHLMSHGTYSVAHIPIPSTMLQSGSNTVTVAANDGDIEYDYIRLEAPTVVENGIYTLSIENSGSNVYTLGVSSTTATNTQVYTYPGAGATLNQWQVINLGTGRNYCEFINVASGLALTGSGGAVIQAPLVGSSSQIWQVEAGSDHGYMLRCSGQGFQAANGGTITPPYNSGSNSVVLAGASGGVPGQNWVFTSAPPVVSCPTVVNTNINTGQSIWVTTGVYGTNFPPSSDYTSSGFTWPPVGSSDAPAYSAANLPPGVTIDPITGLISGAPSSTGTYTSTITATINNVTGSLPVTFNVGVPLSGLSFARPPTLICGVYYSEQITGTSSNATGFGASNLPAGLTINPSTGLVSGTPTTYAYNNPGQTWSSTLYVYNPGGTQSLKVNFTVDAPAPVITSPLTATGTTGSSFLYATTATNAPGSFTASGYPAGLSFNTTTGVLSGTPATAGTSSILLNAANLGGQGNGPTSTLVLTVYAAATVPPVINSPATASGVAGAPFSYTITASNLPTSFSATGLPAGLSLNTATGVISGAATSSGTSTVTLGATNSKGTGNQNLTLTIGIPGAPVLASSGTVPAEALAPFSYTISASNYPTSYNATGLPAGLAINTSTGVISGAPSASGTSTVSLSASNQGGTGTGSITIAVAAGSAPVISSSSSDAETIGVPVNFQVTAANGPSSFTAANLPLGLSVNGSTGLISGTPGLTGSFQIPLSASNSIGSGTSSLSMIVNPPAWTCQDIGAVGAFFGDNTMNTNGYFSMIAAGIGLVGSADAFQYDYEPLSGDGAIIARVTDFSNPKFQISPGSQAGVMIRSSLAANAPFFSMCIESGASPAAQYRAAVGANVVSAGANGLGAPTWVKVVRAGNTFTGYLSTDGVNWAQVGSSQTVAMPATVCAGLFGDDGDTWANGESTYIDFDNVNFVTGTPVWSSTDVGTVSAAGDTAYSGGVYSLVSSGTDIWNSSDQFHYAYSPVVADCTMTARVTSVANTDPNAKAGIMIRNTMDPASTFEDLIVSSGNGIYMQQRTTAGSNATNVGSNLALRPPYWIRLSRTGNTFTAYTAPDGVTWTQLGSTSLTMGTNAYIGLAATSHNPALTGTATIDNITLTANDDPAPPVLASGMSISGTVGQPVNYSVSASNSPTGFASDNLPGGLVMTPSGYISGSPTGSGNGSASITAQNAGGTGVGTVTYSFTGPPPPVILPSSAPWQGIVNQPLTYGISVQNGANVYTATGLPSWLALNASTGVYSGTPTSTGTFTVTETAGNASGTDSATQSFVITATPPDLTSSLNVTGTGLSSFSYTITAGNSPTIFDAINLPPGLSLNTSTGVISGTPLESGTYTFYVTAMNAYGTASGAITLTLDDPVPQAPADLVAYPWDGQVDLAWSAPYDAAGYNVLRAPSPSGPFTVVSTGDNTYYSDKAVVDGSNYYYEVNAFNTTGTGVASTTVMATPVPLGGNAWEYGDIGAVGLTGSTTYTSGTYSVVGSGNDIQGAADAFQFNSQQMTGDGAIVARVVSIQNTSPWAKAGVMMRDSLASNAANACALVTSSNGVDSQWRSTDGGSTSYVQQLGLAAPYWVEVVRAGNVFTTYYSADGLTWTQQTSQTITMPSTIYVGLAVTAQNNAVLCTAKFDNVNILPSPAWSVTDVGGANPPGFTSWSNGILTMNSAGLDIWGYTDQFRFMYQPTSSDSSITAEVTGVENTQTSAKSGVMIRDTLASASGYVAIIVEPFSGAFLQRRVPGGESSQIANTNPNLVPPYWVRLTRSGNFYTAFTSPDGNTWSMFGSVTVTMGTNSYSGIPLVGRGSLGASRVTNITITP